MEFFIAKEVMIQQPHSTMSYSRDELSFHSCHSNSKLSFLSYKAKHSAFSSSENYNISKEA